MYRNEKKFCLDTEGSWQARRVMQELAEAQKWTEIEIQKLSKELDETRGEVGGLSKSMSYAFEN